MQYFKIRPGEAKWQFDNGVVVHVRNDDGGYASVVCWDSVTDWAWSPWMDRFDYVTYYPEQRLSALELAEFLWKMSRYPERITA